MVDVCRQIGVSEATYYTWKKRYGVGDDQYSARDELRRAELLLDETACAH